MQTQKGDNVDCHRRAPPLSPRRTRGPKLKTYRQAQLIKNLTKPPNLFLHLRLALLPKPMSVRFFKADSHRLLQRTHAAIADARVRGGDVLDQMFGPNEPADAPTCSIEVLAAGSDGEGARVEVWGECGDASERDVVEAVVDLRLGVRLGRE